MQSVCLAVEYTPATIHPMHAFVCESPAIERELLLEARIDDGVLTTLFYVEGDPAAFESALRERDDPLQFDVRPDDGDGFFCYVRGPMGDEEATIEAAFQRETVVTVPPTEFRSDMTMRITLVGPGADLSAVFEGLPEELDVEVLSVGSYDRTVGNPLTDRQRAALAAARATGYYEVPRENGIEVVAEELDCSVAAASTLLRRAESRLVDDALAEPA